MILFTTDQQGVRFVLSKQDDVTDPPTVFNDPNNPDRMVGPRALGYTDLGGDY